MEYEKIEFALSFLVATVQHSNSVQLTDINVHAEDFYRDFLNLVLGRSFVNLNFGESNAAAIDLGDAVERLAVQVTSTGKLAKTRATIEKFNKYNLHNDYDRLVLLNISKKSAHNEKFIGDVSKLQIDTKNDIWDTRDLLEFIKNEPLQRLKEIRRFLETHLNLGHKPSSVDLTEALDPVLTRELKDLIKKRKFSLFPSREAAVVLATRVRGGDLQSCSNSLKCRTLAWCARIISPHDLTTAAELADAAALLGHCEELVIARAFIEVEKEGILSAFQTLGKLNTSLSKSAALTIKTIKTDSKMALAWYHETGMKPHELDGEGLTLLLQISIENESWQTVELALSAVTSEELESTPCLMSTAASATLCFAAEPEFRLNMMGMAPFLAIDFPLSSEASAVEKARKAKELFRLSKNTLFDLTLPEAALIQEDYELWLRLRSSDDYEDAIQTLVENMNDPLRRLRRVHWAIQFGINVDSDRIESAIRQETALKGGPSSETSSAAMALIMGSASPEEVLVKLNELRGQIDHAFEKRFVVSIEIEMLARTGQTDKARIKLDGERPVLSNREIASLETLISEREGNDPLSQRIQEFETSNDISDLANLVRDMESKNEWVLHKKYSLQLFQRTKSLSNFERHVRSYTEVGDFQGALDIIVEQREFSDQSKMVKKVKSWALFETGRLNECQQSLDAIGSAEDDEEVSRLRFQLAVTSGDWNELVTLVDRDWNNRSKLSAAELLQAAQIAEQVGHPRAKDLVRLAASSGAANAETFAASYHLATTNGWENSAEVSEWLRKAIELSGADGPIHRADLKELIEKQPDWNRRVEAAWKSLEQHKVPIFGAAKQLNRTLVDLTTLPSVANESEQDARYKSLVYSFSGQRNFINDLPTKICFEPTAILTLGWLDLLEKALDLFSVVEIPHSTLRWLFEEKSKAAFHQPSRIADAETFLKMIAEGRFQKFEAGSGISPSLIEEVGRDLATMISNAMTLNAEGDPAGFVIRSSPVHKIGSFMDEDADLVACQGVMVSCSGLVEHLKKSGLISSKVAEDAIKYLEINEERWPEEPEISENSTIYLDDLSISYLKGAGVLGFVGNLKQPVIVSKDEENEANGLVKLKSFNDEVLSKIESIRLILCKSINDGKVTVLPSGDRSSGEAYWEHPTIQSFVADICTTDVLTDDRFFNHANTFNFEDGHKNILCSLDIISVLSRQGLLGLGEYYAIRHRLRKALVVLVPAESVEIVHLLSHAYFRDGVLVETEELRTLREYYQRIRLANALQRPSEIPWLLATLQAFVDALKMQWTLDIDLTDRIACSDWLLSCADLRYWATPGGEIMSEEEANGMLLANLARFVFAPSEISKDLAVDYENWVSSRLTEGLEQRQPEVFEAMMQRCKEMFEKIFQDISSEIDGQNE